MRAKMFNKYKILTRGPNKGRIEALNSFENITKGDIGGFVESYKNLSQNDNCWVSGNAEVYGSARVYGNARVCGEARVSGNTQVYGDAKVHGDAILNTKGRFKYGVVDKVLTTAKNLEAQLNIRPINGKVLLFKRVNKIETNKYVSELDEEFIYEVGKYAEAVNCCKDPTVSCDKGLHAAMAAYWHKGDTLIAVEIDVKDIICVLEGKVRCSKLKVIGEVD